jgi:hypothetical protein
VAGEVATIAELVRAYMAFAREYYVDADGQVTREPTEIKYGLAPLVEVRGTLLLFTGGIGAAVAGVGGARWRAVWEGGRGGI